MFLYVKGTKSRQRTKSNLDWWTHALCGGHRYCFSSFRRRSHIRVADCLCVFALINRRDDSVEIASGVAPAIGLRDDGPDPRARLAKAEDRAQRQRASQYAAPTDTEVSIN